MLPKTFFLVALLLETISAAPGAHPGVHHAVRKDIGPYSQPVPPKQDPWYTAPDGWEDAEPGDVLRVREAQGNLGVGIGLGFGSAYNILYRTTNSQDQASWAVTTLMIPRTPNTAYNALLAYQVPYDSADLDSSPSYTISPFIRDGHTPGNCRDEIDEALSAGWYVTVPDYEGPLASFTAGVMSGYATLDAVRASLSSSLGLPGIPKAKLAMWGYSGGALGSEWAAELQETYAPELNFSGVAVGGLTPDVFNVFNTVTETYSAGLIPPGVVGLVAQFPVVQEVLYSKLKTTGNYTAEKFLSVVNLTLPESAAQFAYQNIYDYFEDGEADFLTPLVMSVINSDGRMGTHGVPQSPMFVYKAIEDEISPIADTDALIEKYCAIPGTVIQYERNTATHHKDEQDAGSANAFVFLEKTLSGTYVAPPGGCNITNVTIVTPPKVGTDLPSSFMDWADGLTSIYKTTR